MDMPDTSAIRALVQKHKRYDKMFAILGLLCLMVGLLTLLALLVDMGIRGVPDNWYRPFRNKVHSYLIGAKEFRIDDLCRRFARQARNVHAR